VPGVGWASADLTVNCHAHAEMSLISKALQGSFVMNDASNNPGSPSLSILVVDDDELNQRMMLLLLKRDGHVVECVSNGLEAFEAVKSKPYDMVLMDLQMPVMDGVEASRQIREWEKENAHVFIVALTASYLPERGGELFAAGIDNYMPKPFNVSHLRNILQYGLENRKFRNSQDMGNPEMTTTLGNQEFDYQIGVQRVGGDKETYKELLGDFIIELPEKVENIRSCYKGKDQDGLSRAAHNLKGVSANLGALQLSEHAGRLEKQVSESYTETIEGMINDISVSAVRLIENTAGFLAE
jgi:CheY-like chemotaxis protein/HPt (histidine-containing phosphotransfer) domain-containing protein